jgi:hypothetical protein
MLSLWKNGKLLFLLFTDLKMLHSGANTTLSSFCPLPLRLEKSVLWGKSGKMAPMRHGTGKRGGDTGGQKRENRFFAPRHRKTWRRHRGAKA